MTLTLVPFLCLQEKCLESESRCIADQRVGGREGLRGRWSKKEEGRR